MKLKLITVNLMGLLMITALILVQMFSRKFAITTIELSSVVVMIIAIIFSTGNLNFVLLEKKFKDKGTYNAVSNVAISVYLFFTVVSALNVFNWYSSVAMFTIINGIVLFAFACIIIYAFMLGNGKECNYLKKLVKRTK